MSTKINALADGEGLPLRFTLAAGQVHDVNAVVELLKDLPEADVVADRGYDADWIIELILATLGVPHIPGRQNRDEPRSVDPEIYRGRNQIERLFSKLKQFRRIATRYEKLARNYLAAVSLAATRLWARFESTT